MIRYFAYQVVGNSLCQGAQHKVYDSHGKLIRIEYPSTCNIATPTTNPVYHTLTVTANILAIIAGITAVIMIIVAGLTMITSQGNAEAARTSRNRIIYSVVGLIIIALAWSITTYIVKRLS